MAGARLSRTRYDTAVHGPVRIDAVELTYTPQGVFTSLVEQLGVQEVQFEEIISLDAESIEALR